MRKRLFTIILSVLLILCLAGCERETQSAQTMSYNNEEETAGFRKTVLYYGTEDGFIVPVMRLIPWEEGIGKAALGYLVDSGENHAAVDALGLCAPIPAGTVIHLRIDDQHNAAVDLRGELAFDSPEKEAAMVTAIVNTLTEFPAVETVTITLNGQAKRLENGVDLSRAMPVFALNAEDDAVATGGGSAHAMTLYFPNQTASLTIPVTRYAQAEPTFEAAVQALLDGPRAEGLLHCFPEGVRLLNAGIEGHTAIVDFSGEYAAIEEIEGLAQACHDTLYLTAYAFDEALAGLDIRVEGKPYTIPAAAVSAPLYVNEFN